MMHKVNRGSSHSFEKESKRGKGTRDDRRTNSHGTPGVLRASGPAVSLGLKRRSASLTPSVQRKVTVGDSDDRFEKEAERVADRVMRMPGPGDRKLNGGSESGPSATSSLCPRCRRRRAEGKPLNCPDCEQKIQREQTSDEGPGAVDAEAAVRGGQTKAESVANEMMKPGLFRIRVSREVDSRDSLGDSGSVVPSRVARDIRNLRGQGQALPQLLRESFEQRFGDTFPSVRIHTGPKAATLAESLNARAFTLGRDIAFASGAYKPSTQDGKRLLAHELTHVLQQRGGSDMGPTVVQREEGDDKDKPAKGTAGALPHLTLKSSQNGTPCACLVFVHNNERNARKTVREMYEHCAYNLAIVQPDTGKRGIDVPWGAQDPNEMFPTSVVKDCTPDDTKCRTFVEENKGAKNAATQKKYLQRQYFLAIKDCSSDFTLPVVSLHNNDLVDTKRYYKEKGSVRDEDVKGLKGEVEQGVDDSDKSTRTPDELQKRLKELFDPSYVERMLLLSGKTNIFRWCVADALAKCHIGDPDNPDNVVWVTNQSDFERLAGKDVNVALQVDWAKAKGTTAEDDLSTLFVLLHDRIDDRLPKRLQALSERSRVAFKDVEAAVEALLTALQDDFPGLRALYGNLEQLIGQVIDLVIAIGTQLVAEIEHRKRLQQLRYVNIETPATRPDGSAADPAAEYDTIADTLSVLGLHCCEASAQEKIKKGLGGDSSRSQ